MNSRFPCLTAMACLLSLFGLGTRSGAAATIFVHFDQDEYIVQGPGDEVVAQILIDTDADRPGDQPVPDGLFSYALEMTFNPAKGDVDMLSDVVVPGELDFFGFFPPAFVELPSAGEVDIHANVDQFNNPLLGYHGSLLATVTLSNLASAVDSYPLNLDFINDIGPNESHFVDLNGVTLDPEIMFVPSTVRVVPEPSTFALAFASLLCLCGFGWARRRPGE